MSERIVYHLLPEGSDWKVQEENKKEAVFKASNKQDALNKAVELAKKETLGQVKIHKADGTIEEERTYGKDPRNIPG